MTTPSGAVSSKKPTLTIVIAVIVIAVAVVAYLFLKPQLKQAPEEKGGFGQEIPVVPETPDVGSKIGELSNPLGDKLPDLNPVEKANPFKDIKTNPFR